LTSGKGKKYAQRFVTCYTYFINTKTI